jgi:micrococcal nuclease
VKYPNLYFYAANIAAPKTRPHAPWSDVDTVHLDIDMGRGKWDLRVKHRLARIDGYGNGHILKTKGTEFANKVLPTGTPIVLETVKDTTEKWGRYLAEIWMIESDGSITNFNDMLVQKNLALYWNGQGPHPTGEIV